MTLTTTPSPPPGMGKTRKPDWLKVRLPSGEKLKNQLEIERLVKGHDLHTVCVSANCQNLSDCWGKGTATFMVMGNTCTRNCGFCAVPHGIPGGLDPLEPQNTAKTIHSLNLKYVVITSVDRDDLPDGGAAFFGEVILEIKNLNPETLVEILIPDFDGLESSLNLVLNTGPAVVAHNLETVKRLTPKVRDSRFSYEKSLKVLKTIKSLNPLSVTKSGIMLGHGETPNEAKEAILDLAEADCDILTISQYLRPSKEQLEVKEYLHPSWFQELARFAKEKGGFEAVVSGPLIRSSYRAREVYQRILLSRRKTA